MLFQSHKKSLLLGGILLLAALYMLSTRPKLYSFHGQTMGTSYHVSYVSTLLDQQLKKVSTMVHKALTDVDQRMSTYRSDSELMNFNRAAIGEPFHVSADIIKLMMEAEEISRLSDGAYDITVGPLVNLWGFGSIHWDKDGKEVVYSAVDVMTNTSEFIQHMVNRHSDQLPSREAISDALAKVGYQSLKVDSVKSTITRLKPLFVDLSSIAKGHGVDQAAAKLREQGINNYMVEVGGEILVKGVKPNQRPWRLAVIGPEMGHNGISALVELGNKALATSGDYLNFFEINGKRYSHTINPVTGWPEAKRVAEVAVITDTSSQSDALATMFMVLGDKKGLALANRLGIAARFAYYTDDGFATVTSEAFKPYLVK